MYFRTLKESETGKKLGEVYERGIEAWNKRNELIGELMKEYPSMTGKFREPGGFVIWGGVYSILFSEEPDPNVWFPITEGEYMPLDVSEKGKEISDKLSALPVVKYTEINACFDHHDAHDIIGFKDGTKYYGFEVDPKWNVKIPADCEEVLSTQYANL